MKDEYLKEQKNNNFLQLERFNMLMHKQHLEALLHNKPNTQQETLRKAIQEAARKHRKVDREVHKFFGRLEILKKYQ